MQKARKIIKGLLAYNENIAPVMNMSRKYNTYMALYEMIAIAFYMLVCGRTNQSGLVTRFTMQSLICMASGLYIHMGPRLQFYLRSMKGLVVGQVYMLINIVNMLTCAWTTNSTC